MKPLGILTAAIFAASATFAVADDGPTAQQKARQGMMRIIAINMGVLGGMAKGEMAYDAASAQAAADTLVAVSMIGQGNLWPEGSFSDTSMTTTALSAVMEKKDDFMEHWAAFGDAAKGLQSAAAGGAGAIGAAMGKAGGACKSCHEAFRVKQN